MRRSAWPAFRTTRGCLRVSDFFIQLAAICVHLPQTLTGLQAAFPQGDPQEIRRFAFLSAASGLGELRPVQAQVGAAGATPPPRPAPKATVPVKRGFFSAMLARLF